MSRLLVFPFAAMKKSGKHTHRYACAPRHRTRLSIDWLEGRMLLTGIDPLSANLTPNFLAAHALPLTLGTSVTGTIQQGTTTYYQISPDSNGLLAARLGANGFHTRITLLDANANVLAQSDAQSLTMPTSVLQQHVLAGTEYLAVQSIDGSGMFTVTANLAPMSDPTVSVPDRFPSNFAAVAQGDFNGDGIPDLVTASGVHLGAGDGTFGPVVSGSALADLAQNPSSIVVGQFFGTKNLDVAVSVRNTNQILLLPGKGDGTFGAPVTINLPAGSRPSAIVAGNFGSGRLDLAVADSGSSDVSFVMNDGNGTFHLGNIVKLTDAPVAITAGDFTGSGRLDVAIASPTGGDVIVLANTGNSFVAQTPISMPAGATPLAITAANFGTGHLSLAVADSFNQNVYILVGKGDETFSVGATLPVAANPAAIIAGDFGNGHVDLAVADQNASNVAILMGNGNGTFQSAMYMAAGALPSALAAGDFNRDGRLDLASGNIGTSDISILLGKGDGTFQQQIANRVGSAPSATATGDFTGNGYTGLAVVNLGSNDITILPGNGDGTFQRSLTVPLPAGAAPKGIVSGDFNGDGRTDLAVIDSGLNAVSIFLGNGDGTFRVLPLISVGDSPDAIVAADFGNGHIDLAVANLGSNNVTVLMGRGDGSFSVGATVPVGLSPSSIVAGNFGRGKVDLAVTDVLSNDVMILQGDGNGNFTPQPAISLGDGFPIMLTLVTGKFGNDKYLDLAVASQDPFNGDSIFTLSNNGDGTFAAPMAISLGYGVTPTGIVAADFNHDGITDLVTSDANGFGYQDYTVLQGAADGTFGAPNAYVLGGYAIATSVTTADFRHNGNVDLAFTRNNPDDVVVRLGNGDGTFSDPGVVDLVRHNTPIVADLTGTGVADVVVVDSAGNILYRKGRAGEPGSFSPPVTINYGNPSRDIAFVRTALGPMIASVDANHDQISFYGLRGTTFKLLGTLATGHLPAQILAADVTGDGRDDLIVRNAGDGTISVYPNNGVGWFQNRTDIAVGMGVSDVALSPIHSSTLPDLIISNRLAGQVGVLTNLGGGLFTAPVIYQAGAGPYGMGTQPDQSPTYSAEGTAGVATGVFTPGGGTSVVALNPGSNTIGLLSGFGDGRLTNVRALPTDSSGIAIRAADLNGDGLSDLAILGPDGVTIQTADGKGGFGKGRSYSVGFEPNGLTIADVNGDGKPDIVVGNPLGDVLTLVNQGDGTFASVRPLDQGISLALTGANGKDEFIFSDQAHDQLVIKNGGVTTVLGDASTGLVSPGAIKLASLGTNGIDDLIVANSGSNNVLVYPGLGNGQFGQALNGGHGFFTGTNPVGITVADVNGDGRPDLVIANKGSNDISILLNVATANGFSFVPGPRLQVGNGPTSTIVQSVYGDPSKPDLVVSDSGSNDVRILKGLGNGFFNDANATVIPVGTNPGSIFVGQFTNTPGMNIVSVNSGSNDITLISDVRSTNPVTQSIATGGLEPSAAFQLDVNDTGAQTLVVANSGNGLFSIFTPGESSLELSNSGFAEGIGNPSDIALSSFSGGAVQFYAASEGETAAALVSLSYEVGTTPETSGPDGPGNTGVTLAPLNSTSLALLATLLTTSLSSESETSSSSGAFAELLSSSSTTSAVTQPLSTKPLGNVTGGLDEEDEEGAENEDPNQTDEQTTEVEPWVKFVTGLSDSFDQIRQEADGEQFAQPKVDPAGPQSNGSLNETLQSIANAAARVQASELARLLATFRTAEGENAVDQVLDGLAGEQAGAASQLLTVALAEVAETRAIDGQASDAPVAPPDEQPGLVEAAPAVAVACIALFSSTEVLRRVRKRSNLTIARRIK